MWVREGCRDGVAAAVEWRRARVDFGKHAPRLDLTAATFCFHIHHHDAVTVIYPEQISIPHILEQRSAHDRNGRLAPFLEAKKA
jgi:hypothetical protein